MTCHKIAAAGIFTSLLFALPFDGAEARIRCEGNFQDVQGLAVSTPYCREQNLARVARSYGIRVSASAIRYSESAKADVCRTIGHDNRVYEICAPYRMDGGDRFRF